MSRPIKFRAWIKSDKLMFKDKTNKRFWEVIDVAPENAIIMQFTGLHDKEGREIYEGDICRTSENKVGGIYWVQCEYMIDGENCLYHLYEADTWKVIGNIHENPDLLRGN